MTKKDLDAFGNSPVPEACRRIDYDNVDIVPGFVNDTWIAIVSGTKPWATMEVSLVPLIYVAQPDYWEIEVVGCQNGVGLPVEAPYSEFMEVQDMGKKGVAFVGTGKPEPFDVPPK
ncbi:hypothetical protein HT051_04090 [Methyloligella sp. GL2]|nr:hypothetical protein HT051_04090 [Methyloligella sp. GL2]